VSTTADPFAPVDPFAVPAGIDMEPGEWAKLSETKRRNRIAKARWQAARDEAEAARWQTVEPVLLEHRPDHEFVKRAKKNCGYEVDGKVCNRGPDNPVHRGYPPSFRDVGSGDQFAYQNHKKQWQRVFIDLLEAQHLPRGLGRVLAEGELCVPSRVDRDQGNLRFFTEKCLGDALQEGSWLEKDTWRHYEFGNLVLRYSKDESWLRLTLFCSWETPGWETYTVGGQATLL
jgi:hypothetical protein